jgi:hypothetical protein
MSRVLLFVQTSDGRPKCEYRMPAWMPWEPLAFSIPRGSGQLPSAVAALACTAARRADRWWLVECENAEAGRALIADAALGYDSEHPMRSGHAGRILASGGRS